MARATAPFLELYRSKARSGIFSSTRRAFDARHRAWRRCSGPRRRHAPDGDVFGLYPFLLKLYADGGYKGRSSRMRWGPFSSA